MCCSVPLWPGGMLSTPGSAFSLCLLRFVERLNLAFHGVEALAVICFVTSISIKGLYGYWWVC